MAHPFDEIPKQLWLSSQQAARRAVLKHTDDDPFERLLAAVLMGVATETLLMACVATIEVSLLASDAPSKVRLTRRGNPGGNLSPTALKTISWDEGRKIVFERDKAGLKTLDADIRVIMNTRNAAAHAALTDSDDLGTSVVKLVGVVSLLHQHLDFEESDFWGTQIEPMVSELKDQLTTKIRQAKLAKIINAKKAFDLVLKRFPGDLLDGYIETALERPLPTFLEGDDSEHEIVEQKDCPSCGFDGNLFFTGYDDGDVTQQYHDQLDDTYVETFVLFAPRAFDCPVCNLALDYLEVDDFAVDPHRGEFVTYYSSDERYEEQVGRLVAEPWDLYEPDLEVAEDGER